MQTLGKWQISILTHKRCCRFSYALAQKTILKFSRELHLWLIQCWLGVRFRDMSLSAFSVDRSLCNLSSACEIGASSGKMPIWKILQRYKYVLHYYVIIESLTTEVFAWQLHWGSARPNCDHQAKLWILQQSLLCSWRMPDPVAKEWCHTDAHKMTYNTRSHSLVYSWSPELLHKTKVQWICDSRTR